MGFSLYAGSAVKLLYVHPDLVKCVNRATELIEGNNSFQVTEGVRTLEKQKMLVRQGYSKTMNSRHLTGHAVDLVPLADIDKDGDVELTWLEEYFAPTVKAMKAAIKEFNIEVEWGYDLWGWDMPHWQLNRKKYPA